MQIRVFTSSSGGEVGDCLSPACSLDALDLRQKQGSDCSFAKCLAFRSESVGLSD